MAKKKKTVRQAIASWRQRKRREERALRDREAIRLLRRHFEGYDTAEGYSLDLRKIERLSRSQRRGLRKKAARVAAMLAAPHAIVPAKSAQSAKALRKFTGQRMRGMRHFIVHTPTPESRVRVKKGQVQLTTPYPGEAEVREEYYFWPRRATTPDDMIAMLEGMLPAMPRSGLYVMQTRMHGDTGTRVDWGQLMKRLREYLMAYDREKYGANRFMNQVLGFRWEESRLHGRVVKQERDDLRRGQRAANRQRRAQLAREAQRRARKGRS